MTHVSRVVESEQRSCLSCMQECALFKDGRYLKIGTPIFKFFPRHRQGLWLGTTLKWCLHMILHPAQGKSFQIRGRSFCMFNSSTSLKFSKLIHEMRHLGSNLYQILNYRFKSKQPFICGQFLSSPAECASHCCPCASKERDKHCVVPVIQ